MKYILLDKNKRRVMELRISKKEKSFIEGEVYKVYDHGKDEPLSSYYHMNVNLRYEGICNIEYKGENNDSKYYACGVNGMISHMLVYAFLSKIALIESKDRESYTDDFSKITEMGLLDGYTVEFLEEETHIPTRCKSCSHLVGTECFRESLETENIGVCWYEEGY